MPPPTRNIAAVPATESNFISLGVMRRMPRPSARWAAHETALALAPAQIQAGVVQLHDAGHHSVDADRRQPPRSRPAPPPVTANGAVATVPSVITMISAERMKSVRTAPLILSFSSATRSTLGSSDTSTSSAWCASSSALRVQQLVRQLLEALEAQEGAAEHQQRRHRPWGKALIGSAAGTRIALLMQRALATAQTTGSSRSGVDARSPAAR